MKTDNWTSLYPPFIAQLVCVFLLGRYMWNTRTGQVESELSKHKHGVLACAWAPTSAMIVSTDQKGDVLIWD